MTDIIREQSATVERLRKRLQKATQTAQKASEARRALSPGSTRARVTTANARWLARCEERDRIAAQIAEIEKG